MEPLQVIFLDPQLYRNFHIREILTEIFRPDRIIAARSAHGIQDGRLARVVLTDQDQGIFNITDLHVPDRSEIPYP